MLTILRYDDDVPGEPYPLPAFFNPKAYAFYKSPNSKIRSINFIQTILESFEIPDAKYAFEIWKNIRNSSLDYILLEYILDDTLIEMMLEKDYTERDILELVRLIPPSTIVIHNTLTLNVVKGIFSVLWDNPYFEYSNIIYER